MPDTTTYFDKVNEAAKNPDRWDVYGGGFGGGEELWKQYGKLLAAWRDGTLGPTSAEAINKIAQSFAAGLGNISVAISRIDVPPVTPNDIKLRAFFLSQAQIAQRWAQESGVLAEAIAQGSQDAAKQVTESAGKILKLGGLILAYYQMAEAWASGDDDTAAKKGFAALIGMYGGTAGALTGAGLTTLVVNTISRIAGVALSATTAASVGAVLGALAGGYYAGKAAEEAFGPYFRPFVAEMLDEAGGLIDQVDQKYRDKLVQLGRLDGTWLEGLDIEPDQAAFLTTLLAGASRLPVSDYLQADIKKLFSASYSGDELVSRDALLTAVMQIAKEQNAYPAENLKIEDGVIKLRLPISAPGAVQAFRRLVKTQLDGQDETGFAVWGPKRVYIATSAGSASGSSEADLMIGSNAVDGLIGGAGNDELVAGGGDDILLGEEGGDVLFGQAGGDFLDGGANSDYLYGGSGDDIYNFTGTFGSDWIVDSDGQGRIVVDGVTLTGGKKVGDGYYFDKATGWSYSVSNGDLFLRRDSSLNQIRIRDWQTGQLGIALDETQEQITSDRNFFGDNKKKLRQDGKTYVFDADGNYESDGVEVAAQDLIIGTTGEDSISGLAGNDALSGWDGNDFIDGGSGSDVLQGGFGADTLKGGEGADIILGSSTGGLYYPLTNDYTPPAPTGQTVVARGFSWVASLSSDKTILYVDSMYSNQEADDEGNLIDGGTGNDTIYAGSGDDYASGGGDDDQLQGLGGNDVLNGDAGNDLIFGDGGSDPSFAANYTAPSDAGNDLIDGGTGDDTLAGQGADDEIYGGAGADVLYGDDNGKGEVPVDVHGNDYLDGGDGDDKLSGGGREDVLYGGEGNDSLWGDAGAVEKDKLSYLASAAQGDDYLDGEGGNDYLQGEGGDDTLLGGDGRDELYGDDVESRLEGAKHGNDYLDGEGGNDTLTGFGGKDTLYGGDGDDALDGDATATNLGGAAHGDDYLDGEEGDDLLVGHGGNDTLIGGEGDDTLAGDGTSGEVIADMVQGNDFLDGGSGSDVVEAGGGNDTVFGGEGDDYLDGDRPSSSPESDSQGNDYVNGEAGNDILIGRGGNDTLIGGDGDDSLVGDIPVADAGSNSVSGDDYIDGGAGNDIAEGSLGDDTLVGGLGNDTLKGDGGDDLLSGDSGDDALVGGEGNDTLTGGSGTDYLLGGDGDDVYIFSAGDSPLSVAGTSEFIDDAAGTNTIELFGVDDVLLGSTIYGSGQLEIRPSDTDVIRLSTASVSSLGSVNVNGMKLSLANFIGRTSAAALVTTDSNGKQIRFGGTGNDYLTASAQGARVSGGKGNDTLSVTTKSGVTIEMALGDGQDRISSAKRLAASSGAQAAGAGTTPQNVLKLGEGIVAADLSLFGSSGSNEFFLKVGNLGDGFQFTATKNASGAPVPGEQPFDRIQFADGTSLAWSDFLAQSQMTVFTATEGNDVVSLSSAGDVFAALGGDDSVEGLGGNDVIYGMNGQDTLLGGSGNDSLDGGSGNGLLDGGDGNDTLQGGADFDTLLGGNGDDVLRGGEGTNQLLGGNGNDSMYGGLSYAFDTMKGGEGADHYYVNFIPGSYTNADAIDESTSSDDVYHIVAPGTAGAQNFQLFNINDAGGNDRIVFDSSWITPASMSVVYTGTGFELRGWGNLSININDAVDLAENTTAGMVESILFKDGTVWTSSQFRERSQVTTAGNDRVLGFSSNDTVDGGGGDDTLNGGAGDDRLLGGSGYDIVNGGVGNDTLEAGVGGGRLIGDQGDDTYVLRAGDGSVLIGSGVRADAGDAGMDVLEVSALASAVTISIVRASSASENDYLNVAFNDGSATARVAVVGSGVDTVDGIERIRFSDGSLVNVSQYVASLKPVATTDADSIIGTSLDESIDGLAGADVINGAGGNDTLIGGSGNDTLDGGSGDNVLDGGAGDDKLYLNSGHDTVRLGVGSGHDMLVSNGASGIATIEFGSGISRQDVRLAWDVYNPENDYKYSSSGTSGYRPTFTGALVLSNGHGDDVRIPLASGLHGNRLILDTIKLADSTLVDFKSMLVGTSGNDMVVALIGDGMTSLAGGAGDDTLVGLESGRVLDGGAGNDLVMGGDVNDTLIGGSGDDTLQGFGGDNIFVYNRGDGNDQIILAPTFYATQTATVELGSGLGVSDIALRRTYDNLIISVTGGGSITIGSIATVTALPDAIRFADGTVWNREQIKARAEVATAGNDYLVGYAGGYYNGKPYGADSLSAGDGDDVLVGLDGSDTLIGGAGNDTLYANEIPSDPYDASPYHPDGNSGQDTWSIDVLEGGLGDDVMYEGEGRAIFRFSTGFGHDRIVTNNNRDAVSGAITVELGDSVIASDLQVSSGTFTGYVLSKLSTGETIEVNVRGGDIITFADGTTWNKGALDSRVVNALTEAGDRYRGSAAADTIASLGGRDVVNAGGGNDLLDGGSGDDILDGEDGDDTLIGGAGNDSLTDVSGNSTFIGGAGNDTIVGGAGSDRVQFNLGDGQDVFSDNSVGTGDVLVFGVGITATNVVVKSDPVGANSGTYEFSIVGTTDKLKTQGIDSIIFGDGTSWTKADFDALARTVSGTSGNDTMVGSSSVDRLNGLAGNDSLSGLAGDDWLDGGSGIDTLVGGSGNDTFVVDDSADVVTEVASQGTDKVLASASYVLSTNVENLELTGTGNINATGNGIANTLRGNSGNNTLDGGAGSDTMVGGAGDDVYVVDAATDVVVENVGEGVDTIMAAVTLSSLAGNVENVTLTGTNAIGATGNALANVLTGNSGTNRLDGGAGDDTMIGGAGNDTYVVGAIGDLIIELSGGGIDAVEAGISWTLGAELENLTLTGTSSNNATGNSLNNTLTGNSGANRLEGGAGNDTMVGGAGNDTYVVDSTADVVTEVGSGGIDTIETSVTLATLAAEVENLTLTGTADLNANGNGLANTLRGNTGNNTLDGGSGADTLIGGAGDDTYIVDATTDVVTESAGEGTDTLITSVTLASLAANVENLTLTGSSALNATGNALANLLTGNAGANRLDGGAGADTMVGGAGNDTYVVDNAGDVISELASGGTDAVEASVSYTLGAEVENLILTGTASDGTGNSLANTLTGNSSANRLNGGGGNDTMVGGAGNDTYVVDSTADVVTEAASGGTDTIETSVTLATLVAEVENLTLTGTANLNATGNSVANVLRGNSGDNILTGGAGNDTLIGGAGNDTYVLDVATDVVTESAGEGTDTIQIGVTLATLAANVENVTLTGTSNINATGNALANVLTGNSGANNLSGGDGDDTLIGGAGADTMVGGLGNDVFYVDATTDVVTEASGQGTDTIMSSVTLTAALASNVENVTLTGTSNLNALGNALANVITGNSGANNLSGGDGDDTLDGGAGIDTLVGGLGNDIFYVDSTSDVVTEASGQGTDTIMTSVTLASLAANVENLTLTGTGNINGTGSSGDNVMTGNAGNNTLTGAAGNDTLDGKAGNDTLNGGAGADTYWFGLGYGSDLILDSDATANVKDVVRFTAGIAQSDIRFTQSGNALVATIKSTNEALTIQDWYLSANNRVEEFRFNDGTVLTNVQAQALVGAMAAFNPSGGVIAMVQEPEPHLRRHTGLAVSGTA